jgi:hypothetical protein
MVSCEDGLLVEDIYVAGEAVVELVALAVVFTVPAIADTLDQHPPTLLGLGLAMLAIPAVLVADALHKRARRPGRR